LLLPWQETSVIGHILHQWQEIGASQIIIIHRPNDTDLFKELDRLNFPAQNRIENSQPERGMFSSILCAAQWNGWNGEIMSRVIVLGDQPHLRLETLRELVDFHFRHLNLVCQPFYGDHERHPVILPRNVFEKLKISNSETLKVFLKLISSATVQYPMNDPGLALDMDTPEDYKKLKNLTSAR
jgi:molybdenum cofactor cytidylyltransferase